MVQYLLYLFFAIIHTIANIVCIINGGFRRVYVWIPRSERLNKIAEVYEQVYLFEKVDEEQGDYQLLRFIEDYTR